MDRGAQFTSRFLSSFQKGLGTKVKFSTTFLPQKDGQAARTIQTLKDMFRACIIDLNGIWDKHFTLVEFSYNNSHPFPLLPLKPCMVEDLGHLLDGLGEPSLFGPELVCMTLDNVQIIRNQLRTAYIR